MAKISKEIKGYNPVGYLTDASKKDQDKYAKHITNGDKEETLSVIYGVMDVILAHPKKIGLEERKRYLDMIDKGDLKKFFDKLNGTNADYTEGGFDDEVRATEHLSEEEKGILIAYSKMYAHKEGRFDIHDYEPVKLNTEERQKALYDRTFKLIKEAEEYRKQDQGNIYDGVLYLLDDEKRAKLIVSNLIKLKGHIEKDSRRFFENQFKSINEQKLKIAERIIQFGGNFDDSLLHFINGIEMGFGNDRRLGMFSRFRDYIVHRKEWIHDRHPERTAEYEKLKKIDERLTALWSMAYNNEETNVFMLKV